MTCSRCPRAAAGTMRYLATTREAGASQFQCQSMTAVPPHLQDAAAAAPGALIVGIGLPAAIIELVLTPTCVREGCGEGDPIIQGRACYYARACSAGGVAMCLGRGVGQCLGVEEPPSHSMLRAGLGSAGIWRAPCLGGEQAPLPNCSPCQLSEWPREADDTGRVHARGSTYTSIRATPPGSPPGSVASFIHARHALPAQCHWAHDTAVQSALSAPRRPHGGAPHVTGAARPRTPPCGRAPRPVCGLSLSPVITTILHRGVWPYREQGWPP